MATGTVVRNPTPPIEKIVLELDEQEYLCLAKLYYLHLNGFDGYSGVRNRVDKLFTNTTKEAFGHSNDDLFYGMDKGMLVSDKGITTKVDGIGA